MLKKQEAWTWIGKASIPSDFEHVEKEGERETEREKQTTKRQRERERVSERVPLQELREGGAEIGASSEYFIHKPGRPKKVQWA